ncbi:Rpn family recombination-promoting nuclease/putative transposase [Nocardia neocaledoniensis]|uniref:Rpn family recombination-promoting nuclease/putative transposase n=1 Tax=Nocardia neocaledoniensis TaxID=236511 RepID=UPI00340B25A6
MGDSVHHPHDGLVKHTLSKPENAAALARPIVEDVAPVLATRISWAELERESVTFVSKHLAHAESDVLYRSTIDGDRPAYIYVLHEHQSSVDKLMAFRLLEYVLSIWKHHRKTHPGGSDVLSFVLPIVTCANPKGGSWTASTQLADLIDVDDEVRIELDPYLPRLGYLLNDLTATPLAEILARLGTPATRILQVLLKVVPGNTRLHLELRVLESDLRRIDADELCAVLTYILSEGDTAAPDLQTLVDDIGPEAKEAFMSTASRLRAEGSADGQVKVLLRLMTQKFGPVPARVVTAMRGASQDQIDVWAGRLLSAKTLDDLGIA